MRKPTEDQLDQLSWREKWLYPILEKDELPLDNDYYLKNDHSQVYWRYTKIIPQFVSKEGLLICLFPDGTKRPLTLIELNNTFIYIPNGEMKLKSK